MPTEKVDLSKQEQVSFESKEELLRLTHGILLKNQNIIVIANQPIETLKQASIKKEAEAKPTNVSLTCEMCSKSIEGHPIVEQVNGKSHSFDSIECVKTYKKLKSLYGETFE